MTGEIDLDQSPPAARGKAAQLPQGRTAPGQRIARATRRRQATGSKDTGASRRGLSCETRAYLGPTGSGGPFASHATAEIYLYFSSLTSISTGQEYYLQPGPHGFAVRTARHFAAVFPALSTEPKPTDETKPSSAVRPRDAQGSRRAIRPALSYSRPTLPRPPQAPARERDDHTIAPQG